MRQWFIPALAALLLLNGCSWIKSWGDDDDPDAPAELVEFVPSGRSRIRFASGLSGFAASFVLHALVMDGVTAAAAMPFRKRRRSIMALTVQGATRRRIDLSGDDGKTPPRFCHTGRDSAVQ